jgi:hypothetical protein
MDTIESQKQKYINKQKLYLHKWSNGLIHNIPRHRVYEHLWALKLGHLMWDDLPPDFGVRFKLPSKRDCGVDTVSWEYNQTGQIKLYSKGSRIAFGDMSNFYTYSTLNLGIDDMCVGTTPEAEFTAQAKNVCTNSSMCIKRQSFDELRAILRVQRMLSVFETQHPTTTNDKRRIYCAWQGGKQRTCWSWIEKIYISACP